MFRVICAKSQKGNFSAEDLRWASIQVINISQAKKPPSVHLMKKLGIYEGENGTFRYLRSFDNLIPTRLVYLPHNTIKKKLFTLHIRRVNHHAGVSQTLAQIRQTSWIHKGRMFVKKTLREDCFICKRHVNRPFALPDFAPLPSERVNRSRPFEHVGIDCFGPIYVRIEEKKVKTRVCLITCFVVRAIHMEAIGDMSAITFLNALRRFIARRGKPSSITSDNAAPFHLVAKAVQEVWSRTIISDEVQSYCATEGIEWNFIPLYSPWAGGVCEHMIHNVKTALGRMMGKHILKYDVFNTLITEVEGIINSRPLPLTYIPADEENWHILRPIDFLNADSKLGIPWDTELQQRWEPTNSQEQLLKIWSGNINLLEKFWQQWSTNYLQGLRERYQYQHKGSRSQTCKVPQMNEIVLVADESLPRPSWKLARIVGFPGSSESQVRSAYVKFPNGREALRSISHLVPLEVWKETEALEPPKVEEEKTPTQEMKKQATPLQETNPNLDSNVIRGGENRHPMLTRSKARMSKKIVYFIACIIIFFSPSTKAAKCDHLSNLTEIYRTSCQGPQIIVMRESTGELCYLKQDLEESNNILLAMNTSIGSIRCHCQESWATSCSFYNGKKIGLSTIRNQQVWSVLQSLRPKIRPRFKVEACDTQPKVRTFQQIELYDGTRHLVDQLNLQKEQYSVTEYFCIGEGSRTGTKVFCESHSCNQSGTQFCLYNQPEMTQLVTDETTFPIKAWGL